MANETHTLKLNGVSYVLAPMWDNVQNKCINASTGAIDINKVYDFTLSCVHQGSNLPSAAQYGSLLTLPYRKPTGNSIPDFGTQILIPNGDDSKPHLYFRTSHSATWDVWKTVLDSSNYTGYTYAKSDIYTKTETDNKIAALVDSAPSTLNTLNELAAALGDDKNFSTTVTNLIAGKADKTHSHSKSEITDFTHTHSASDITDFPAFPNYTLRVSSTLGKFYLQKDGADHSNITINLPSKLSQFTNDSGFITSSDSITGSSGSCTGNAATASSVAWTGITGKPSTFTPSSHTHSEYVTTAKTNQSILGAKTFEGKLSVRGGGNQLSLEGGVQFNMVSGNMTIASGNITLSSGKVSASGGFFETSDERLKVFGSKIPVDFERLRNLRKNYFNWRDSEDTTLQIGVSAQEVKDIYPELVQEDKDGNLTVAYDKLAVVALAAVDELYKKNQELEERIQKLESIVNELIK